MVIMFAQCEECNHHIQVYHLDWYALVCPECKGFVQNDLYDEKPKNTDQHELALS